MSPEGSVSLLKVNDGSNVTLTCIAQGGPGNNFSITHNGVEVTTSNSIVDIDTTNSELGGIYVCTVSNIAGTGSATAVLNSESIKHSIAY